MLRLFSLSIDIRADNTKAYSLVYQDQISFLNMKVFLLQSDDSKPIKLSNA